MKQGADAQHMLEKNAATLLCIIFVDDFAKKKYFD